MKSHVKNVLASVIAISVVACSDSAEKPLVYHVSKQDLAVKVPAKGELFAAKATVISSPISNNGMQNIAWLAPEFSRVKKGDVIVRFDGEAMQVQSQKKQHELAITEQDILEKNGALEQQLSIINKDIGVVDKEKDFADRFSIDDIRIRSKLEILESMQNKEYLGTKQAYLQWKNESFSESSEGEIGLLNMQQQQHQAKINQLEEGLTQLEVLAPHDGLLAYKANWRGEKPRAGQALWPGQKIAELPDVSDMKAKLQVAESEAIGLKEGQEVDFYLNAHADKAFKGTVESVATYPKSIKRGDPRKYYEVTVTLAEQVPSLFVPGRKLAATIAVHAESEKLVVPLQSIHTAENQHYVYVYQNGEFDKVKVELGIANLSVVEVVNGLSEGQEIALTNMEQGS